MKSGIEGTCVEGAGEGRWSDPPSLTGEQIVPKTEKSHRSNRSTFLEITELAKCTQAFASKVGETWEQRVQDGSFHNSYCTTMILQINDVQSRIRRRSV